MGCCRSTAAKEPLSRYAPPTTRNDQLYGVANVGSVDARDNSWLGPSAGAVASSAVVRLPLACVSGCGWPAAAGFQHCCRECAVSEGQRHGLDCEGGEEALIAQAIQQSLAEQTGAVTTGTEPRCRSRKHGKKELVEVSLNPGIDLGLIRRGKKILAVTRLAPTELQMLRPGDSLVEINGDNIKSADHDLLQAFLNSLQEGSQPFSLKFKRDSTAKDQCEAPDFYEDQETTAGARWFSYWDLDHDDRLDLECAVHAIDKSFRLRSNQYAQMRSLIQSRWQNWDATNQGISLHQCMSLDGFFEFLCSDQFQVVLSMAKRNSICLDSADPAVQENQLDENIANQGDGPGIAPKRKRRTKRKDIASEETALPDDELGDASKVQHSEPEEDGEVQHGVQMQKFGSLLDSEDESPTCGDERAKLLEDREASIEELQAQVQADVEDQEQAQVETQKSAADRAAELEKERLLRQVADIVDQRPLEIDRLRDALRLCEESGLGEEPMILQCLELLLVEEERRRVQAQQEARRRAQEARRAAAARAKALLQEKLRKKLECVAEQRPVDVDRLRDAVQLCEEADLGEEQATIRAKELLLAEEARQTDPVRIRAVNALNAAIAARPANIDVIEAAIQTAENTGICEDEVLEARKLVAEKRAKQGACRAALLEVVERLQDTDCAYGRADIDVVSSAVEEVRATIAEGLDAWIPEPELAAAENLRRQLHNACQDLKGAIRVYCRLRPALEREMGSQICTEVKDFMNLRVSMPEGNKPPFHEFTYDRVFASNSSQDEVFHDCTDLVQSVVDGHNITIFAYGQTGAGKTFTMYGSTDQPGIAPRTIDEIFRKCARDAERFRFVVKASMLEVYNSEIKDLLLPKANSAAEKGYEKPQLRLDASGTVQIQNIVEKSVAGAEALAKVLHLGHTRRKVASTAMNSDSSRSHLVLMVVVESWNRQTGSVATGQITVVDLAGSERLKKSEVTGDQQKEAIEINKSLTALGDVIEALTAGKEGSLIPYRNHKLTLLLQNALGGTSKTLMFVNISPMDFNRDESLMSLKYAQRAKKISPKTAKDKKKKSTVKQNA